MASKIPLNAITVKYTSGGELVDIKTNTPYKGYYYEFNSKMYAGKEYTSYNPELVKIQNSNKLLNNKATAVYSVISGISSQQLNKQSTPFPSVITEKGNKYPGNLNPLRFFCQKINTQPIIIKEITEQTYNDLQSNPLYKTTYIGTYKGKNQTLVDAESQVTGVTLFVESDRE
jgi:hypothetical protein